MINLSQVRESKLAEKLFCEAMSRMWHPLEFRIAAPAQTAEGNEPSGEVLAVGAAGRTFCRIQVSGGLGRLDPKNRKLIHNASSFLGWSWKKNLQKREMMDHRANLEKEVEKRTAELESVNQALRYVTESISRMTASRDVETFADTLLTPSPTSWPPAAGLCMSGRKRPFS
jgi:hypothetical protein